ncbi:hypothetical protein KY359_03665 [Candidatus Woesearchaeota archaeon]|nr:hypothetical protein [Candidatus Woesearchaeota archaeon]
MKEKPKRNYLLLGASLLTVGLLVEFLSQKVVQLHMNVFYKTIIIMFMIAIGYSFAEGILAPLARSALKTMQHPFVKLAGPLAGAALFYIVVYAVLFGLYLLVFIYGLDLSHLPAQQLLHTNMSA